MNIKQLVLAFLVVFYTLSTRAQIRINQLGGQTNPITVAVPFLGFAPDSRGAAMGDAGVATSADAYSVHWNNAKLAFIENDFGFSFSYSPWLGNIVDDMSLNYLSFYKKIDRIQTIAVTMRYFDMGEIQLTDLTGLALGLENPREAAFDVTYARILGENLSAGLTLRYVWSNLTGNITGAPSADAGTSIGFDLGLLYRKPLYLGDKESLLSMGAHLSNIGQKISYTTDEFQDFIPGNLRIGTAFTTELDPYNSLTFALDFNKLMVPTPPRYARDANGNYQVDPATGKFIIESGRDPDRPFISGTFGSFTDAPGGFREELKEISISTGFEYWYRNVFAVRAGYFYEHVDKGDRKYFTTGLGFRYQVFGVDFSYLIPQQQNHPLGDTLRLSFIFNFDKKEDISTTP